VAWQHQYCFVAAETATCLSVYHRLHFYLQMVDKLKERYVSVTVGFSEIRDSLTQD
jgi:hypothetical protein